MPSGDETMETRNDGTRQWGWAGLGLGALALLGLAIWAWPERKQREAENVAEQREISP
jgi:hypothetical protein